MADAIEIFTSSASERIEVVTSGAQGPKGDAGGATFDQDLNTTDAVTFASVNAPLYDAALNQPGAGVDDAVFSIYAADGTAKLDASGMTGLRVLTLPDESGTLALVANTATAAQGALADTAVQPNTAPTLTGLSVKQAGAELSVSDNGTGSAEKRATLKPTGIEFLLGDGTSAISVAPAAGSGGKSFTLPSNTGTLALTSDIPTTFAASAITSGTLDTARLGSGTASASTYLRGDSTWATTFNPAAPGAIGGTTAAAGTFTSLAATGLSISSGTITASAPFDFSQTWNNAAVTFTGLKLNVTDTASAAASLFLDLRAGGSSKYSVRRDGMTCAYIYTTAESFECYNIPENAASRTLTGRNILLYSNNGLGLASGNSLWWSSNAFGSGDCYQNRDLFLLRDAAGTLAQRNGANAQEFRLYNTYTSSTNYQRGTVKCIKQTLSALSGASATTTGTFIPDGAVVVGVTTRVGTAITGATSYSVGDGSDVDRWGGSIAVALNTTSDNRDWTAGTVECFTSGGNVTLTANGSNFTGGAVEICVFYLAGEAD